jgi:glutamate synthase domain-containing protein 2/nitrite reductase/ring-hydroxylating ferredoxin subunit
MTSTAIARLDELEENVPWPASIDGVDVVLIRRDGDVHVFEGRCLHRGALLADGTVEGSDLVCGLHGWRFRLDTGVAAFNPAKRLHKFTSTLIDGAVHVLAEDLAQFRVTHPASSPEDVYERLFSDPHQNSAKEPYVSEIHGFAAHGLPGPDGPVAAMGVPRDQLPQWDDLQLLTAQLSRFPKLDDESVDTAVTIGPSAKRPLRLNIPVFVSDMSFGAVSEEAKVALSRGAEAAGTAICSGEGGMLPEEHAESSRYLYELASGRFGWDPSVLSSVQALHIKLGQGAKTGTGGHLPGSKVIGRIAQVRGLPEGTSAISPSRFVDWSGLGDAKTLVDWARQHSQGIPIGVKMSAQHIEADLDAALELGVDYVILDGRGGGTGAAPTILRDSISVPTMAALARARRHLARADAHHVTLVATGGFRRAQDMVKALALGADAIAVSNAALQAIGCVGMRACHTGNCPVGIATQKPHLRARLPVQRAAEQLTRFLEAVTTLMVVMARACGHSSLSQFTPDDLTSWKREVADLAGVAWAGVQR